MKKFIIGGIILLIVLIIIIVRVIRGPAQQVIAATDTAGPAHLVTTLSQTGVIKPQVGAMISIGARATGALEKVNVKVGDKVKAGQLVAKIDSRAIRQNIKQSRDTLNKAKVDLDKVVTLYPVDRAMQLNTIESSKSSYEYLKGVYEREQALFDKGFSRQETLDKTRHDMVSAQSEYQSQQLRLNYLEAEYKTNVASLNMEISRQQSLLEEQEIQLTYTEIYSPIDGMVSAVSSVEGETIVAGLEVANLITVFRPELLEMYAYVDESDVGKVTDGMKVTYTVDTYPGRQFTGNISRINLQSETVDSVIYYVAIVDITKEDALLLRPEMTTSVRIIAQERDADLTIQSTAVKWEAGQQVVYKVLDKDKNVTEKLPVKIGQRGEDRLEVLEGLSAGDVVVVRFVQPGDDKKPMPQGPPR